MSLEEESANNMEFVADQIKARLLEKIKYGVTDLGT